jgi:hypothetical protein
VPTESQILSDLLSGTSAAPYANPERMAPSTFYDLQYRMFIISACLRINGRSEGMFQTIAAPKLRLLQFIAMRPWLLDVVKEWSASRKDRQRSLQSSQSLRRGFLSDVMHDNVVDYLVAAGCLFKQKGQLAQPIPSGTLSDLYDQSEKDGLFATEIQALRELDEIVITNDMLEGW